jgi:Na+/alanine symporter
MRKLEEDEAAALIVISAIFLVAFTVCFAIYAYNQRCEKFIDAGFVEKWSNDTRAMEWVKP